MRSVQVNVRLTEQERQKLVELAEALGVSESELLRSLIVEAHGRGFGLGETRKQLARQRAEREALRKKVFR
jgi:hypothetical protein